MFLSTKGLLDLDLPIAEEPNVGFWKITVVEKGQTVAVAHFQVLHHKVYFVPKFDLQIEAPSNILVNQRNLVINACAK